MSGLAERAHHQRPPAIPGRRSHHTDRWLGGSNGSNGRTSTETIIFGVAAVNLSRNFAHRLKDTSPFSEASILPEFVDYYFHASRQSKNILDAELRFTNYSAVDMDVLRKLYLPMYEQRLDGAQKVFVRKNSIVTVVHADDSGVELTVQERHYGNTNPERFDLVVLATGFRNFGNRPNQEAYPPLLSQLAGELARTETGCVAVGYDYRVSAADGRTIPPLILYHLNKSSHGISEAGSFSLLSLRAETIVRTVGPQLERATALRAA